MIRISIRQRPDGLGFAYYAGLSCYPLPYPADYQGCYATRALARAAARAEGQRISKSLYKVSASN